MDGSNESIDLKEYFVGLLEANDKYYNQRFDSSEKAVSAALAAADRAVQKAETASEKRFDSVNEFRNTLADQQRTLMPRGEVEVLFKAVNEKLDLMGKRLDKTEGIKTGSSNTWGYVVGLIGVLVAVFTLLSKFIK